MRNRLTGSRLNAPEKTKCVQIINRQKAQIQHPDSAVLIRNGSAKCQVLGPVNRAEAA